VERLRGGSGMKISDCCALLGFSKQAYYKQRIHHEKQSLEKDVLLREVLIIRQSLPVLGGRKLYALLDQRLPSTLLPGRDKFFEFLRSQGLLIRKRREYRPITTVSWHHFHKYPNLWKGRIPDGPHQVWASDITYVRMADGKFLYLSLITDVYSHKIVGWFLSESLGMEGPLNALKMALKELPQGHQLIHHSDRGVQYCSHSYVNQLQKNGIQISMTENGDPRENAVAERVNGILKEEWFNREVIASLDKGRTRTDEIVRIYNEMRPHMSNDYLTPEQAHLQNGSLKRRWKTYYKKKEGLCEQIS
jgi:transposase InsO family protein